MDHLYTDNLEDRIKYAFEHSIRFLEISLSEYKEMRNMITVCLQYGTWKIMPDVYFDEATKEEFHSGQAAAYLTQRKTRQEIKVTVVSDVLARIGL